MTSRFRASDLFRPPVEPSAELKLQLAQEINQIFQRRCAELGVHPDPQVLALALSASANPRYVRNLFGVDS